jgi:hypothetical protein
MTSETDKMLMGFKMRIISHLGIPDVEFPDYSLSAENPEVPIDRTETDMWNFFTNPLINPFGIRMQMRILHNL